MHTHNGRVHTHTTHIPHHTHSHTHDCHFASTIDTASNMFFVFVYICLNNLIYICAKRFNLRGMLCTIQFMFQADVVLIWWYASCVSSWVYLLLWALFCCCWLPLLWWSLPRTKFTKTLLKCINMCAYIYQSLSVTFFPLFLLQAQRCPE